jgi:hypothetical protein
VQGPLAKGITNWHQVSNASSPLLHASEQQFGSLTPKKRPPFFFLKKILGFFFSRFSAKQLSCQPSGACCARSPSSALQLLSYTLRVRFNALTAERARAQSHQRRLSRRRAEGGLLRQPPLLLLFRKCSFASVYRWLL